MNAHPCTAHHVPRRRRAHRHDLRKCVVCVGTALFAPSLGAQVTSVAASIPTWSSVAAWSVRADSTPGLAANSLTLLNGSGAIQNMPSLVDNKINTFPVPVSITTQWQLSSIVSLIDMVGYFAAPSAALSNGSSNVPSTRVEGRMVSGRVPSYTPFNQQPVFGSGTPGGTLHLYRQRIIFPINGQGQRTDVLNLRLNLEGAPSLPPGTYRGTLTLRAVSY